MTPFSPCPLCGGNRAAANSHDPNPCTCPTGPIWGELVNILPANYNLDEGQRLFPTC